MLIKRKLFKFFCILAFVPLWASAQSTDNLQYPLGLHWKMIHSEYYDIIFPEAIYGDALRVANTLDHVYKPLYTSLQKKPKRYSVILSNQITESNAYVAWAPRKAEFFSTPPQGSFLGTGDWYSMLAIHEGRHMVQYDKFNSGLVLMTYIIFGQMGPAIYTMYLFPLWWWEGDAVCSETALSNVGRGRLPEFNRDLRTILLSGKKYNYFKAYNLSYKDYYPNHYVLGYHMIAHLRNTDDENVLSKIAKRTTRSFFIPYPLNRGLHKETKYRSVRYLYASTMQDLDSLWNNQLDGLTFNDYTKWGTKKKDCWTNYNFPQYLNDSSIIVQKYGLDHVLSLVELNKDGKEHKLLKFSPTEQIRASYANGRITWSEMVPDVRWGNRDFSVVKLYDVNTGRQKRITSRGKLFAPSLSNDGKRIVTVEFSTDRKCTLAILDAETGNELQRLPNPENRFITTPSWNTEGNKIVFVSQIANRKYLTIQNTDGTIEKDINFNNENITNPVFFDRYILYNSPYSAIDNIYAINIATLNRYQITCDKFGAYYPAISPDGKRVSYATYHENGFNAAEMRLDTSSWKKINEVEVHDIGYYKPLVSKEKVGDVISNIPDNQYEIHNYPWFHKLVPHSWTLLPLPPFVSLTTYSNDLLNNTFIGVSGMFDGNENTYNVGGAVSYSGFFPIINAGVTYATRSDSSTVYKFKDTWTEKTANVGITLPFDFSRSIHTTKIELSANLAYKQVIGKDVIFYNEGDVNEGDMKTITYQLSFLHAVQGSVRDFNPPFAQQLMASYTNTPMGGNYRGDFLSVRSAFYFPGFFKHHSIRICGNFEYQKATYDYIFQSNFLFPRGYTAYAFPYLAVASADYAFPIAYPDLSLRHFFYIKRVKGDLYYDYGIGALNINSNRYTFRSTGAVMAMDFIPFSLPPSVELEFGVRFSYLIDNSNTVIEPVFSIYF